MQQSFKLSFLPFAAILLLAAGTTTVLASHDSLSPSVIATNGVTAYPDGDPDKDCPPESIGGGIIIIIPLQTNACPQPTFQAGYGSPVPDPTCPEGGIGIFSPIAAGVNANAGFYPGDEEVASDQSFYSVANIDNLDSSFVDAVDGDLTFLAADLSLGGKYFDLNIARTYRSSSSDYDGVVGLGWEINTNRLLDVTSMNQYDEPQAFSMALGSGLGAELYTRGSGSWFSGNRGGRAEYKGPGDIVVYDEEGLEEKFDDFGNGWWFPVSYTDTWGQTGLLSYGSFPTSPTGYNLDAITDELGRTLTYDYYASHGRLKSISLAVAGSEIARIDYTYDPVRANGQVTLAKVEGLEIATDSGTSTPTFVRKVDEYTYWFDSTANTWLLNGVKNGKGELEYSWEYSAGQVTTQKDRPGATAASGRVEGIHSYIYAAGYTDYLGPDGEHREFHYDSSGRITKRRDEISSSPSVWREVSFEYNDPTCSTCPRVTKVIFPDGGAHEMQYDTSGNILTKWWYPSTGSSAPNRVERWAWKEFDPKGGELRTRLLEHELVRDAHPNENPNNACNHPSCSEAANVDGHIVYLYNWSTDGLTLESVDYGTVQVSSGGTPTYLHREMFFDYFVSDGRLKTIHQLEDSAEIAKLDFKLSISGNYYSSEALSDPINGGAWETTFIRDSGFLSLLESTDPSGVTTAYLSDEGGRVYWVGEDYASPTATRDNNLLYDAAGRLVRFETVGEGGLTELRTGKMDVNGLPYEVSYTGPGGTPKIKKFTWSLGGRLEREEDWRGWGIETTYGEGAFMLPIEVRETLGTTQSRSVWKAGFGSEGGYDEMGRLLLWVNTLDWKNYREYEPHGRIKRVLEENHEKNGVLYYSGLDFKYDARGYVKEIEVGAIKGSPSSIAGQQWHQHHVLTHNLAGHKVAHAVYESGATNEARMERYLLDGQGRRTRKTMLMGDRSLGLASATGVVEEYAFDANNRLIHQSLLGAGVGTSAVEEFFFDYLDSARAVEVERIDGGGSLKEKTRTEFSKLGLPTSTLQSEWLSGSGYSGATRTTTYTFDGLDRLVKGVDPLGVATEWVYDDLSRVEIQKRLPSIGAGSQNTSYAYNATYGYLDSVTDPEGGISTFIVEPNNWMRLTKETYQDGRYLQYTSFDDLDRVLGTMDSRGITHAYTYDHYSLTDDITNVASLQNIGGDEALRWTYDPWLGTVSKSEVLKGGATVWETQMTHNDLGERISEIQGGGTSAASWSWDYGYAGELRDVTYPSGLGIDDSVLTYGSAGRLNTVTYTKGANTLAQYTLQHTGKRVISRTESVSQIGATYGFDGFGRWDSAQWEDQSGSTAVLLEGEERVIDTAGRVTSRQRVMDSVGDVFVQDGYGRMSDWYSGVAGVGTSTPDMTSTAWSHKESYALNDVYGRTSVSNEDFGQTPTTVAYVDNDAYLYTQVGTNLRTTNNGFLNSDGTYDYLWGAWGKLIEVRDTSSGNLVRTHQYDAGGRRVRTTKVSVGSGSETTRYLYWGPGLAASFIEGTTNTDVRTYGYLQGGDDETLVVVEASGVANGTYELARDFQGSILAMIDRTNGSVVERYRYSPFGAVAIEDGSSNPLSSSAYGNDRFFMGRVYDSELGIYDVRNRWYDPETGSFLSPDPLLAVDSWNMYQYGFGAAATWMDPYGLNQEPGDQNPPGGQEPGGGKAPPTEGQISGELITVDKVVYAVVGETVLSFPRGGPIWASEGTRVLDPVKAKEVLDAIAARAKARAAAAAGLAAKAGRWVWMARVGITSFCSYVVFTAYGFFVFMEAAEAAAKKPRKFKKPKKGSGKEKANDVPSWARGKRPYEGESGKEFAKRILDAEKGAGNWDKGKGSEFGKLKKWGDRGFE